MCNLIAFCQQIKNREGKAEIYIHYSRSCAIVDLFVLQSSTNQTAHLHVAKLEQFASCANKGESVTHTSSNR